jgi:hypothetical protein
MLLTKYTISPLLYGIWVLRTTNDNSIEKGLSYFKLDKEPIIKLKTLQDNKLIGIKKSRTAFISDLEQMETNKNFYKFKLNFSTKNFYSYSFLGIQFPELKSKSETYNKEKIFNVELCDKMMFITYDELYYIFDLYIGKIKYPNIETSINTFIFTQIFGIFLNLLIMHMPL